MTASINRPLKVAIISHSDMLGGAAIFSYRLAEALRQSGTDARMVVYTKMSESQNVDLVSTRFKRGLRFVAERARIFVGNGFSRDNLFKVSIANTGTEFHNHPWVQEADIILLGWINQGMLSFDGLKKLTELGKPMVWNMHDMWNLTGICHHAHECSGYLHACGNCMFLGSRRANDLSHSVWLKKEKLYAESNITFVAVSNWLAEKARRSTLLSGKDVRVIPNAIPVENFITEPTHMVQTFNMRYDVQTIVMGAARLDDPIKGIDYAIDALNYIFDNHPRIASQIQVVFFGALRDKTKLDRLRLNHKYLGRVNDWRMLRQLYASSKIVLSTSLYETFGGTLIEGIASGCLAVSFGEGGQHDIISHKKNGFIARYKDPRSVAEGILWALNENPDREALHKEIADKFASEIVAGEYNKLFQELITRKNNGNL